MCGIAGTFGRFDGETARRMGSRIAHRGPDDVGFYEDSDAGLAFVHRRLAILDPSPAGHQPMASHCGRYVICYNGEVYNFPELKRDLEDQGVTFRSNCDTEAIVEMFAREGAAAFSRLNGIFALGVWDKVQRTLTLARDGLGVKPLYLSRTPSGIAFASELKSLLEVPDLDRTVDQIAAISYLTYLWSPGERTMFRSVRKLAPGTWLQLHANGEEVSGRFYALPRANPLTGASERDLVEGTRAILRTAVHRQMLADVDVGAFLSGGLDSSAIVAFACEQAGQRRLQCFTIDYDEKPEESGELVSDLPYARQAARHLGVDLHEVRADASMSDQLERLVYTLDEPEADPAALNSLLIAQLARSQGIKVLLSGTGGDDVFSGYRRHQAAGLETLLTHTPLALRQGMAAASQYLPVSITPLRRIRKLLEQAGRGSDDRIAGYFEWLSPEFANALLASPVESGGRLARAPLQAVLDDCIGDPPLERMLRVDQHFFLTDHNLNYSDKTGMAVGVEIRVPFLDQDLMSWAARVPTHFKMRGGVTKYVFRKAMEGILPHDIIYRPKTGFGVPLRAWLRNEMREQLEELLSEKAIRERGLFNAVAVTRLKERTFANKHDASYTLLALMMIELWMRRFADQAPREGDRLASAA